MSYRTRLTRTWWLKNKAFKAYMLREATVLPMLFFVLCLLAGIYALGQGETAWQNWLATMRTPLVWGINALALIASLYHALTFFQLFPRVMPIRLGRTKVPDRLIVAGQWLGVVMVFVLAILIFGGKS